MGTLLTGDRIDNWINGARHAPANGEYLESVDPSTGKVWIEVPGGDARDVDAGVAAAKAAFEGPWREMPAMQRAAARCIAGISRHGPSNAAFAAATPASTSRASPPGTSIQTFPVDGSTLSRYSPFAGA